MERLLVVTASLFGHRPESSRLAHEFVWQRCMRELHAAA
jgi:hypothetical protein